MAKNGETAICVQYSCGDAVPHPLLKDFLKKVLKNPTNFKMEEVCYSCCKKPLILLIR